MPNRKIYVAMRKPSPQSLEIRVTVDGDKPLTPQEVLDAVSDYLLIDPRGLFNYEAPRSKRLS